MQLVTQTEVPNKTKNNYQYESLSPVAGTQPEIRRTKSLHFLLRSRNCQTYHYCYKTGTTDHHESVGGLRFSFPAPEWEKEIIVIETLPQEVRTIPAP